MVDGSRAAKLRVWAPVCVFLLLAAEVTRQFVMVRQYRADVARNAATIGELSDVQDRFGRLLLTLPDEHRAEPAALAAQWEEERHGIERILGALRAEGWDAPHRERFKASLGAVLARLAAGHAEVRGGVERAAPVTPQAMRFMRDVHQVLADIGGEVGDLRAEQGRLSAALGRCWLALSVLLGLAFVLGGVMAVVAYAYHRNVARSSAELARTNAALRQEMSERRKAEEESRAQQEKLSRLSRLSTLSALAGSLAHELNQPLTAAASYADACQAMLDSGRWDRGELAENLVKSATEVRRAGEIVRRIRASIGDSEASRTRVDLQALVAETVTMLDDELRRAEITVTLDLSRNLPAIYADPFQIQQVLVNLLRNAIEALGESPAAPREISITTSFSSGLIDLTIRDTGRGLAATLAGRVGSPFVTTKPNGMGLGLPISRSIIEAHDGQLSIASSRDGGTMVRVTLPTGAGRRGAS